MHALRSRIEEDALDALPELRTLDADHERRERLRTDVHVVSGSVVTRLCGRQRAADTVPGEEIDRLVRRVVERTALRDAGVRGIFGGLPTFLRAHAREASRGGAASYRNAGRQFGRVVGDLVPDDVEADDWVAIVAELDVTLDGDDEAAMQRGAWSWIVAHFPAVGRLVPAPRRAGFVAGVRAGRAEAV